MITGKITAQNLLALKPDLINTLTDAIEFEIIMETDPNGRGNLVKVVPTIHDKSTDGFNLGDITNTPGLEKYIGATTPLAEFATREHRMVHKESDMASLLVKMADQFDQEGEFELAADVDQALRSLATRPKAPLKSLDDDVKKNLIIFVDKADKNVETAIKGLNEFFRRLRYFDVAEHIKDMGLDRVVRDLARNQECLGDARNRFYEITHGKKPSKQDMSDLLDDGEFSDDGEVDDNALDFFAIQDAKTQKPEVVEDVDDDDPDIDVELEIDIEDEGDLENLEDILEGFWDDIGLDKEEDDESDEE